MSDMPKMPDELTLAERRKRLKTDLPNMSVPDILHLWFEHLPDPRTFLDLDQEKVATIQGNLELCGVLLTELRRKAVQARSTDALFRVHVMADEMQQVAQHLAFRRAENDPRFSAARSGLAIPGYNA